MDSGVLTVLLMFLEYHLDVELLQQIQLREMEDQSRKSREEWRSESCCTESSY